MISTIAIVIAGVSLIIVVVTMYRNTSNPVAIIDTEMGSIVLTEGNNGMVECQTTEVAIVDSELNLIV